MTVTESVSVVICAYTEERWELLCRAIESVSRQTVVPEQLIVCTDHNPKLCRRVRQWAEQTDASRSVSPLVLENRYPGRLGSARNTAVDVATGDIVAFLDDDAEAAPTWLERLLVVFRDEGAVAVGGRPVPRYETAKPGWFPEEYNWVYGCAYPGLPTRRAPARHLIGAAMAARTDVLREVGGFHSDNHDDMDLSHRTAAARPDMPVVFEPDAVVHHFVGAGRVTPRYFVRRCFTVNRGKVRAFRDMEAAGNLGAEIEFVRRALTRSVPKHLAAVFRGDPWGVARAAMVVLGMALAGTGNLVGRVDGALGRDSEMLTAGLEQPAPLLAEVS